MGLLLLALNLRFEKHTRQQPYRCQVALSQSTRMRENRTSVSIPLLKENTSLLQEEYLSSKAEKSSVPLESEDQRTFQRIWNVQKQRQPSYQCKQDICKMPIKHPFSRKEGGCFIISAANRIPRTLMWGESYFYDDRRTKETNLPHNKGNRCCRTF